MQPSLALTSQYSQLESLLCVREKTIPMLPREHHVMRGLGIKLLGGKRNRHRESSGKKTNAHRTPATWKKWRKKVSNVAPMVVDVDEYIRAPMSVGKTKIKC